MDLDDLARTGSLADGRVVSYLNTLDPNDVIALLNVPATEVRVHVTPGDGWKPGYPRPSLADEDPAVMAAIGRCALARWRGDARFGDLARTTLHPGKCGWCDYPAAELDKALRWAQHFARLIEAEEYVWRRGHDTYRRSTGRVNVYENVAWAAFAALPAKEQRYLVDAAVAESRANLEPVARPSKPKVEHVPWCDLRDDHDGDCPNPPEEA